MSHPPDQTLPAAVLSADWLAAFVGQSHELLATTDAAGCIAWCNHAFQATFGLGAGADLLDLAPARWLDPTARPALSGALAADLAVSFSLTLRRHDGQPVPTLIRATPVGASRAWSLNLTPSLATPAPTRPLNDLPPLLKVATELADIVIWRHDLRTDRVHYDEHGFKVLGIPNRPDGLSLDEARGHTHPDDVHKLSASTAHALATGIPIDVEVRHRVGNGWRDVLVRRVIERDAAGHPIAFVGVLLDVTDQAANSRRAEHLARRLEGAARAAQIGIWSTNIQTGETEWNAQMYALFDTAGVGPPPTLSEWIDRCVHPHDRERTAARALAYMRGESGAFESELRILSRGGRVRWMVLRADFDRSGTDAGRIFGIAMDVTLRHESQHALHLAGERAALIAHHAGIGTWETRTDDDGAHWDEQMWRLRGLAPRPVALDRDERLALLHPDDRAGVIDSYPSPADTPPTTSSEFRVRWPDGSYRWLASRTAALFDAKGELIGRVGVNWDVTESRDAEQARQQALLAERESRAKSQFLARMSHELRTPLNAVLGFTQLLQLEARQAGTDAGSAMRTARLEHIRSAGEHLLMLIDDALDLSSLQAGTQRLDMQEVNLAMAVSRALPLVSELATANRVSVHVGTIRESVDADPTRLQQVLLNLLTNAIKYNRPGGRVDIESGVVGDHVQVRVRDNGRGMRPDQLAHLFEPFNRLGLESEGIEGSGIGLTIVKTLVENMGGWVTVSSQKGLGTQFELMLVPRSDAVPAAATAAPVEPFTTAPEAAPAATSQLLYIEDNDVNVLLVEELVLRMPGVRFAAEGSGAAGVARARSLRPDLILIDMQLPDFDGHEVLRRLRGDPVTASIPCVALSANAMPEDIERALAEGFVDYWTKPIRFQAFIDGLTTRLADTPGFRPATPPGRAA